MLRIQAILFLAQQFLLYNNYRELQNRTIL